MATKKTIPKTEVAVRSSTAVAKPGSWREAAKASMVVQTAALAKLPQQTGNFLSLRGGVISLGGRTLSNPLPIVVLAFDFERVYYSQAYQPDVMTAPDCYSFDGVKPHDQARVPQSDKCVGCRYNDFGSAQNGKGKACKEGGHSMTSWSKTNGCQCSVDAQAAGKVTP